LLADLNKFKYKFIELFNILDKSEAMTKAYFKKSGIIKRYNYQFKIVLVQTNFSKYSIEYSESNMRYQLREQIDFASILYNKYINRV
jgi:hypothetical protein